VHKIFWHTVPPTTEALNELCNFLGALHPRHQLVFDIKVYGFCHAMLFRLSWYSCLHELQKQFAVYSLLWNHSETYNGEYEFTTSVCTSNPCFHGQLTRKVGAGLYSKLQRLYCAHENQPTNLLLFVVFWSYRILFEIKLCLCNLTNPKGTSFQKKAIDSIRLLLSFIWQVIQVLFQCTVQVQFLYTCKFLEILKTTDSGRNLISLLKNNATM
jgi:hypothetical protein